MYTHGVTFDTMKSARIRALYRSINESLDNASAEAAKEHNSDVRYFIEEAQELLQVLVEEYRDEDPLELDFD